MDNLHFFPDDLRVSMPPPDLELLASLERKGVPTIHNMIMSDNLVSKLPYQDALAYATFLVRKLRACYQQVQPSCIIGAFDRLHGGLALAVACEFNIPWFAMYFSPLPSRHVGFCTDLTPASLLTLEQHRRDELRIDAAKLLDDFEAHKVKAFAYIPPKLFSAAFILGQIPRQFAAVLRVVKRRSLRNYLKYTDPANSYSVTGLVSEAFRLRSNIWKLHRRKLLEKPGEGRYVFFGLHMQPESSIDVFAHFFSNQVRVIELMARSIPPTHRLLVKLHKSDAPNYSPKRLREFGSFPGVQLVSPYADTRQFICNADLVFSIQGTIGLEAALLGKPVIMFGDSAVKMFPSVSTIGRIVDLPALVRQKIATATPPREQIVSALASHLARFYPASENDWTIAPTDAEIDGFVHAIGALEAYLHEAETVGGPRASLALPD